MALEALECRLQLATDVFTFHNDIGSTGHNPNETLLTPANVHLGTFGKLRETPLDGNVYAQPLVDRAVSIANGVNTLPGAAGVHDVVFVATQHNSLYAIDASSSGGQILWKRSFIDVNNSGGNINNTLGASAITTLNNADTNSGDISPEVGITGTPVIDPTTNVIYLVARTKETIGGVTHYVQRLHAINTSDGTNAAQPLLLGDTTGGNTNNTPIYAYGSGDGSVIDPYHGTGQPVVQFNALRHNQRPALSLVNNRVYIAWASHGDNGPYHGWVVATNVTNVRTSGMSLSGVLNLSPNDGLSGIWQSGGRLAFEPDGSAFYFETGNGSGGAPVLNAQGFPVDGNYNEALVKVVADPTTSPTNQNVNGWGLKVADYFIPYNVVALDVADSDFGSGAPLVLPASAGIPGHPKLLLAGGKEGKIYVVDRDNMGKYNPQHDNVLNAVPNGNGHNTPPVQLGGLLSTPAYYNGKVYMVSGYDGNARAYTINSNGTLTVSSETADQNFGFAPGSISITSNGTVGGIVWIIDRQSSQLHAYDANSLSTEYWNSGLKPFNADAVGATVKFAVPTVANGMVYVGTLYGLTTFGLTAAATQAPNAPSLSATTLSGSSINLTWTDSTPEPNTAAGYKIERSTDNQNFSQVTTAPAGATSIAIGSLSELTTYYFRIRGFNDVGDSPYSNTAQATTTNQVPLLDFSSGFAGSTSQLRYNGSAAISGTMAQLTAASANQAGSFFSNSPVDITRFNSDFTFQISAGAATAEGFMFTIQSNAPTALGAAQGGLGFMNIGASLGIKFDLVNDQGASVSNTGAYTGGAFPGNTGSINLAAAGLDLHSGHIFRAQINYDGQTIGVVVTDTSTNQSASQNYTINVPNAVANTLAYVGFTGSTGAQSAQQQIRTWTFAPNASASPNAPIGLGATVTSATSVLLNWQNTATNQTGFRLDRATDPNFTQNLITQTLPASPNSFTDTANGLAPSGTYYYRLRAYNAAGDSGNSNTSSVTIPVAPPTPTNQRVVDVTTTTIAMQWQDNAGHLADGYKILRAINRGTFVQVANLPRTSRPAPSTYEWQDTNLSPGNYYEYHIVAFNVAGNNDFAGLNATTLTQAPANLTATIEANTIRLNWNAVAGAQSYNVYRGTSPGQRTLRASGIVATTFQDTSAVSGTTYYYAVTAVNANTTIVPAVPSESAPSAEVSATLGLAGPANLTATPTSSSQIHLSWVAPAGAIGIDVFVWTGSSFTKIVSLAGNATSYNHNGLSANTYYLYAVRALYPNNGKAERYVSATTLTNSGVQPPANLAAMAASTSRINLTWQAPAGNTGFDVFVWVGNGYSKITSLPAGTTSFSHTGLSANTFYNYAVRAKYANGHADANISATTFSSNAFPGNLTATPVSSSQINLSWQAPGGVTGFDVFVWNGTSYTKISSLSATTTTFQHTGLAANTYYNYVVRAKYTTGHADAQTSATTLSTGILPVSNLLATPQSSSQIRLTWQQPAGVTGYDIFVWTGSTYSSLASLPAGTSAFNHTGLASKTYYNYAVRAKYSGGHADAFTSAVTL